MLSKEVFGGLATALSVYTYAIYAVGIRSGKTKPHVFSWLIWGFLLLVTCAAQVVKGAGPGAWMTGLDTAACLAIAASALKIGEKHITRSDWYSLIGAASALPLWFVTGDPFWSVVLVTLISVSGFWPTFRKSWSRPWSEVAQSYMLAGPAYALSLAALKEVNGTTAFYPAVLMAVNMVFGVVLLVRRRKIAKPV